MNETYPKTYSELIDRIADDLRPRLKDSALFQIRDALHHGRTLALIAEFVGYRHVELRERDKRNAK